MDLKGLTLLLSRYNFSKRWWLPTSWRNFIISQKTSFHNIIAVITRNVSSKNYCLLQVLVLALQLVSSDAFIKWYPDPQDCYKYYLRIDNKFYHRTCPNLLVFNQYTQQCTVNDCTSPDIMWLNGGDCNQNKEGYFCNSPTSYTYCTRDGLKVVDNINCPNGRICEGPPSRTPCVLL